MSFKVGFFLDEGSPVVGREFHKFIWGPKGIQGFLDDGLSNDLGEGLGLILVRFLAEGPFTEKLPVRGISSYRAKERAIATNIPVPNESFRDRNELERARFIADSVIWSVNQAQQKLSSKLHLFDFSQLADSVTSAVDKFVLAWKGT